MGISVLGAGAFGTSIAIMYSKFIDNIKLYSLFDDHVHEMQRTRINQFLPDFKLPENIDVCSIKDNCNLFQNNDTQHIFWAFPIKATQEILDKINDISNANIIICSKGLLESGEFIFELFEQKFPNCKTFYLAGPNFAIDLAALKFSCANIGARNIANAVDLATQLSTSVLKLYPTDDVVGMQICAAVKNVVAIACGIMSGLNFGQDAHAAVVTLGLQELVALGEALNCKHNTFLSFCGIGDMLLTSSSELSRNMTLGKKIAENNITECLSHNTTTCEGYNTITQLLHLAKKHNVKTPICQIVYDIINCKCNVKDIVKVFDI